MKYTRVVLHGPLSYSLGRGQRLAVGTQLLPMEPSNHLYHDPAKLRHRLDKDGFLLFKHVVPRGTTEKALEDISRQMLGNGWTTADARKAQLEKHGFVWGVPFPPELAQTPLTPCNNNNSNEDSSISNMSLTSQVALPPPTAGFGMTETIKQALCGTAVMTYVRQVFGGGTTLLPHYELEMSPPGEEHGFLAPRPFTCRGTKLLLCAWVPLHDITLSSGPLIVVRGSNTDAAYKDIRSSYCSYDIEAGDIHGDGCLTHDAAQLLPLGWSSRREAHTGQLVPVHNTPLVSSSLEAGDLVLSTVYTLRSYLTNVTDTWRISGGTYWMMEGDDVGADPRYWGTDPPGMSAWLADRDNQTKRPRSMEQACKEWGILQPQQDKKGK